MTILGVLECINLYIVFKTDLFFFFFFFIFILIFFFIWDKAPEYCLFVCLSRSVRGGTLASPWTTHGPFQAHTKVQVWIASIG